MPYVQPLACEGGRRLHGDRPSPGVHLVEVCGWCPPRAASAGGQGRWCAKRAGRARIAGARRCDEAGASRASLSSVRTASRLAQRGRLRSSQPTLCRAGRRGTGASIHRLRARRGFPGAPLVDAAGDGPISSAAGRASMARSSLAGSAISTKAKPRLAAGFPLFQQVAARQWRQKEAKQFGLHPLCSALKREGFT